MKFYTFTTNLMMSYLQCILCCPGDNVLLSADKMVAVLADFGLAVRLPLNNDKYQSDELQGTLKFMSKEVFAELSWSSLQYILVICPVNII